MCSGRARNGFGGALSTGRFPRRTFCDGARGYDAVVVLIGLVSLAMTVGFTVDVFVQNADPVQVVLMGRTFSGRPGLLVVAGALVLLIVVFGSAVSSSE